MLKPTSVYQVLQNFFNSNRKNSLSLLDNSAKGGEIGDFFLKIWKFSCVVRESKKIGCQTKFDFVLCTNKLAA
jgi:hypothetical protein